MWPTRHRPDYKQHRWTESADLCSESRPEGVRSQRDNFNHDSREARRRELSSIAIAKPLSDAVADRGTVALAEAQRESVSERTGAPCPGPSPLLTRCVRQLPCGPKTRSADPARFQELPERSVIPELSVTTTGYS